MDKKIIDALIKFGLITNICIDHSKYDSIDDLISKGVVTIPGAKATIERIIAAVEELNKNAVEETIEETVEETIEETVEETIEETVIEQPKTKKRKSKKSE